MSITLSEPTYHQDPTEVAPGSYLIHEVQHALGQPISVFINSAVIDGDEPVLIDTGSLRNRQAWPVAPPVGARRAFRVPHDLLGSCEYVPMFGYLEAATT